MVGVGSTPTSYYLKMDCILRESARPTSSGISTMDWMQDWTYRRDSWLFGPFTSSYCRNGLQSLAVANRRGFRIICSKTKVAPLKRQTIPQLELSGAVLLTKLVSRLIQTLNTTDPEVFWTDSKFTLTWVNYPKRGSIHLAYFFILA